MKAKLGPAGATTATAQKIAIIFYTMLKNKVEYDASLWAQRDAMIRAPRRWVLSSSKAVCRVRNWRGAEIARPFPAPPHKNYS
jgi:hypothetical protein